MSGMTRILLPILILSACLADSTAPAGNGLARIRLHVTGGLAGVDYTLLLDGPGGSVIGESCVLGCDFDDGEILHTLSRDQSLYLTGIFLDSGIHSLDGTDFGFQCCDQFHYGVTYWDRSGTSEVSGSSEALPADLRDAVSQVHGLLSGTVPVVVDFRTDPEDWPADRVEVQELSVNDNWVNLRVSFGGGCAVHDFKLVAWGGWMESFPVQVRSFLSHDGKDDPCDAIVFRDLAFDLRPLKKAYEESYGAGEPGQTTLIILLENPDPSSSLMFQPLEYVF
jgi:hypothetical protein